MVFDNRQSASFKLSVNAQKDFCEKLVRKKRGRSFNRRDNRGLGAATRILRDKLAMAFASKEFHKEMNQFEKTVKEASSRGIFDIPMPDFLCSLKSNLHLMEGNLNQARIANEAVTKYPPLENYGK